MDAGAGDVLAEVVVGGGRPRWLPVLRGRQRRYDVSQLRREVQPEEERMGAHSLYALAKVRAASEWPRIKNVWSKKKPAAQFCLLRVVPFLLIFRSGGGIFV